MCFASLRLKEVVQMGLAELEVVLFILNEVIWVAILNRLILNLLCDLDILFSL